MGIFVHILFFVVLVGCASGPDNTRRSSWAVDPSYYYLLQEQMRQQSQQWQQFAPPPIQNPIYQRPDGLYDVPFWRGQRLDCYGTTCY